MSLRTEIFEQPAVMARLLETHLEPVQEMARTIRERKVTSIFLAARGTSDNAGIYGKYLWGAVNQLPVALAAPQLQQSLPAACYLRWLFLVHSYLSLPPTDHNICSNMPDTAW